MMAITFIAPPNDRSPIHLAPYKLPKWAPKPWRQHQWWSQFETPFINLWLWPANKNKPTDHCDLRRIPLQISRYLRSSHKVENFIFSSFRGINMHIKDDTLSHWGQLISQDPSTRVANDHLAACGTVKCRPLELNVLSFISTTRASITFNIHTRAKNTF